MKTRYICTLPARDRFRIYKAVKAYLLLMGVCNYENIVLALSGRVSDIDYIFTGGYNE